MTPRGYLMSGDTFACHTGRTMVLLGSSGERLGMLLNTPHSTGSPIRSMQRLRNPMQTCHRIPPRGPLSAPQTQAMLSHSFLQGMLPILPTLPAETAPALPSPEPPSLPCHRCSSSSSLIQQACSEYAPHDRCHTSRWAFNSEQSHRSHSLRP